VPTADRYATLKKIRHPTLIVLGSKDIVVQQINAFILADHLSNPQLIVYPDASHGAQYLHGKKFLEYVKIYLSEGDSTEPERDSIKTSAALP
jgi:pimeloyl-ACP methyl ester carboxylesterase